MIIFGGESMIRKNKKQFQFMIKTFYMKTASNLSDAISNK